MAENKPSRRAHNFKDLTGQKFGRLTVTGFVGIQHGVTVWECLCECGHNANVRARCLCVGLTKSCGCLRRETAANTRATHGMTKTPTHHSWIDAKQRCFNPHNKNFAEYGGRGISMDPAWIDSFETFLKDMGPRPLGGTLDRINNDLGYIRGNTRWASRLQQTRNRKHTIIVTIAGETMSLAEFAERIGFTYSRAHYMYLRNRLPTIMQSSEFVE